MFSEFRKPVQTLMSWVSLQMWYPVTLNATRPLPFSRDTIPRVMRHLPLQPPTEDIQPASQPKFAIIIPPLQAPQVPSPSPTTSAASVLLPAATPLSDHPLHHRRQTRDAVELGQYCAHAAAATTMRDSADADMARHRRLRWWRKSASGCLREIERNL